MNDKMNEQRSERMPVRSSGQRFWRIWGPFLIEWGIQMAVSIVATAWIMYRYASAHPSEALAAYEDQEAMVSLGTKVLEIMQDYTTVISGVAALAVIPVMLFLYFRDRKREARCGISKQKQTGIGKYLLLIAFAAGVSLALNNLILIGNLSQYSDAYETAATAMYSAGFGVQILCLGILVPIAEELVFRGLMFRRMREDTGARAAILYSALIFGIFHGNFVQTVYGFLMGLVLAWLCETYGSVLAPIAAHITANFLAVFGTRYQWFAYLLRDIRVIGAVTVAAAVAAAVIYLKLRELGEAPAGSGM